VESVGFAIFADIPLFSQAWLQFSGAGFKLNQTVINRDRAGVIGGARGKELRVETFRRAF